MTETAIEFPKTAIEFPKIEMKIDKLDLLWILRLNNINNSLWSQKKTPIKIKTS